MLLSNREAGVYWVSHITWTELLKYEGYHCTSQPWIRLGQSCSHMELAQTPILPARVTWGYRISTGILHMGGEILISTFSLKRWQKIQNVLQQSKLVLFLEITRKILLCRILTHPLQFYDLSLIRYQTEARDCIEGYLPKVMINKHTPLSKAIGMILFQNTWGTGQGLLNLINWNSAVN